MCYVTWKEIIPKGVVLFPVSLPKTERLSNNLIVKLKTVYKEKCKT